MCGVCTRSAHLAATHTVVQIYVQIAVNYGKFVSYFQSCKTGRKNKNKKFIWRPVPGGGGEGWEVEPATGNTFPNTPCIRDNVSLWPSSAVQNNGPAPHLII